MGTAPGWGKLPPSFHGLGATLGLLGSGAQYLLLSGKGEGRGQRGTPTCCKSHLPAPCLSFPLQSHRGLGCQGPHRGGSSMAPPCPQLPPIPPSRSSQLQPALGVLFLDLPLSSLGPGSGGSRGRRLWISQGAPGWSWDGGRGGRAWGGCEAGPQPTGGELYLAWGGCWTGQGGLCLSCPLPR